MVPKVQARGFTYIGLMFAIAVLGITLATVGVVWSTQIRRDKEAELLWIGDQYRMAIGSLPQRGRAVSAGPHRSARGQAFSGRAPVPAQAFPDPMTGQMDWELIPAPGSGIMGSGQQFAGQAHQGGGVCGS